MDVNWQDFNSAESLHLQKYLKTRSARLLKSLLQTALDRLQLHGMRHCSLWIEFVYRVGAQGLSPTDGSNSPVTNKSPDTAIFNHPVPCLAASAARLGVRSSCGRCPAMRFNGSQNQTSRHESRRKCKWTWPSVSTADATQGHVHGALGEIGRVASMQYFRQLSPRLLVCAGRACFLTVARLSSSILPCLMSGSAKLPQRDAVLHTVQAVVSFSVPISIRFLP